MFNPGLFATTLYPIATLDRHTLLLHTITISKSRISYTFERRLYIDAFLEKICLNKPQNRRQSEGGKLEYIFSLNSLVVEGQIKLIQNSVIHFPSPPFV